MWSLFNIKKQQEELRRKANRVADHTPLADFNSTYQLYTLHTRNAFGWLMSCIPGTSYFSLRIKCATQISQAHIALNEIEKFTKQSINPGRNIYHSYPRTKQRDSKPVLPAVYKSPLKITIVSDQPEIIKYDAPVVRRKLALEAP